MRSVRLPAQPLRQEGGGQGEDRGLLPGPWLIVIIRAFLCMIQ